MARALTGAKVPGHVELLLGANHGWGGQDLDHTRNATYAFFGTWLKEDGLFSGRHFHSPTRERGTMADVMFCLQGGLPGHSGRPFPSLTRRAAHGMIRRPRRSDILQNMLASRTRS